MNAVHRADPLPEQLAQPNTLRALAARDGSAYRRRMGSASSKYGTCVDRGILRRWAGGETGCQGGLPALPGRRQVRVPDGACVRYVSECRQTIQRPKSLHYEPVSLSIRNAAGLKQRNERACRRGEHAIQPGTARGLRSGFIRGGRGLSTGSVASRGGGGLG